MRVTGCWVAGLFLVATGCSGSSSAGDLFMPGAIGGAAGTTSSGAAGEPGAGSATGGASGASSSGSSTSGAGGSGAGGQATTGTSGGMNGAGGQGGGSASGGATGMSGGGGIGDAGAAGGPAAGGAGGGVGDGSAMGGRGGASTDAGGVDAGPTHPIRCGNVTCLAPAQFCCIPNVGVTRCLPTGSTLCPNAGDQVHCDDHTDCGGVGEICCARDVNGEGFSDCRLRQNCTGQTNAQLLCDPRDPSTCPPANTCRADVLSTIDTYPYCH